MTGKRINPFESPAADSPQNKRASFTGYQRFVIAVLAFLQFTIILDFMILAPLGAILMPALRISAPQFGLVVSAYAFSAGVAGLLAAGFADKFDRKKLLLFFYAGFIVGTFLCGLAPSYSLLTAARMTTGFFGGVLGSIVFAITTDLFPFEMRGRVMGIIQSAFAGSQVLGIPAGLYLASRWGWHVPFFMISAVGSVVGFIIWLYLKPIDAHLKVSSNRGMLSHIGETVTSRAHLLAFFATALMATGGFMLMPFSSAFSVNNLGVGLDVLPFVYLYAGLSTIIIGPLVGRLSDAIGLFRVFTIGSLLSIAMVLVYTHLGKTSFAMVVLVNIVLFAGIFSRMIPFQALTSAIPKPSQRGSFMSISSAIQQVSGGIAAVVAGLIVTTSPTGAIEHYDRLGFVVVVAMVCALVLTYFVDRRVKDQQRRQSAGQRDVPAEVNVPQAVQFE